MTMKLDRRGAIAAVTAVVMIPVIGFAGLAVDLTRIWLLNARLKTAVDAASLVAARTMTSATRDADTTALFWANFNQNGWSQTYLGSTVANTQPVIQQVSDTQIRVTATANINTTLFSIISRQTTLVQETSLAEREGTGLELAIVLDQTSSMLASASGFSSKLAAAQSAVGTLLGTLYGTSDTRRNLWVSVVPFARTINVGSGNTNFLNTTNMATGWNVASWSGCVEARDGGEDITDTSPATTAGQFRPYFYASTYRRVGWVGTTPTNTIAQLAVNATAWTTATGGAQYAGASACTSANAYSAVTVNMRATATATNTTAYSISFCRGDNDWSNPNGLSTSTGNGAAYNPEYAARISNGLTSGTNNNTAIAAAGRNTLCAMNSILPLTASRTTVQAAVNAITAPVKSGGTTVPVGMQGAWYTLSPNWQSWWPNIATGSALGTLPLAYNTRNMTKAVVILTDGDNNWQGFYGSGIRGSPTATELLYNAYGRVADWNANFPSATINPVSQTNADPRLDTRLSAICTAMKGTTSTNPSDHRIRIYVIGFEVAQQRPADDAAELRERHGVPLLLRGAERLGLAERLQPGRQLAEQPAPRRIGRGRSGVIAWPTAPARFDITPAAECRDHWHERGQAIRCRARACGLAGFSGPPAPPSRAQGKASWRGHHGIGSGLSCRRGATPIRAVRRRRGCASCQDALRRRAAHPDQDRVAMLIHAQGRRGPMHGCAR